MGHKGKKKFFYPQVFIIFKNFKNVYFRKQDKPKDIERNS